MDSEQAKIILSAHRPGGPDADDPVYAEALALAGRDPELARWLAGEIALDERMHAAVRSVRAPDGLRKNILLAAKVVQLPAPRAWWSRPAWLATAAALALFAGVAFFIFGSGEPMTLAGVTSEMARLQRDERISLGAMTSDPEQVRRWLREQDAPHEFTTPAALAGQSRLGCQVLDIRGNKVSLVCFQLAGGKMVHLLVMERGQLADAPAVGKPVLVQDGELAFASWSDDTRTYVLAGRGSADSLRQWL